MSLKGQSLFAAGLVAVAWPAAAQELPTAAPGVSVYERTQENFEPKGFGLVEGISVKPSIQLREYYDSNVFASEDNERDDMITQIRPGLKLEADRGIFSVEAVAEAAFSIYNELDNQDTEEWNFGVAGDFRPTPIDTISAGVSHQRVQISREDPEEDQPVGGKPRMAHVLRGQAAYAREVGPWVVRVGTDARDWNYLDSTQEDRDRVDWLTDGRIGYKISPLVQPYFEPFYENKDYDRRVDFNNFDRDASRAGALVGAEFTLGDVWTIDAAAGGGLWMFDDARFDDDAVWIARFSAGYNVTPSTTLKARLSRDETQTTRNGAATKVVTAGGLGVEHAILPNALAFADVGYRNTDFSGGDQREDDNYDIAVGGRYYFNSNFSLLAQYIFSTRDSNLPNEDFDRNVVWVGLEAAF